MVPDLHVWRPFAAAALRLFPMFLVRIDAAGGEPVTNPQIVGAGPGNVIAAL